MTAPTGPMRIQFGTGTIFFNPLTGFNPSTPSTPRIPGSIQDFSFENTSTVKELRSQNQYPDDAAASDKKATFKIGAGRFDIDLFNNLFGGEVQTTGGSNVNISEAHNVPATNPTTVTVLNSAQFLKDLGVVYALTGQPLARVSSAPTQGQYSVSAGVYTFALADAGVAMLFSYTSTVTTGTIVTALNHPQGYGPRFEIIVAETYQELTTPIPNYLHIYEAVCTKFSMPFKRADYLISDIEGDCFANAAGQVYDLYAD